MSRNPTFANLADRPFRIAVHPSAAAIRKSQTGYKPAVAPRHLVDGVFQGGGALGTAYVGALRVLHDNAIGCARVAGNSAGSITAAMIAVGFTAPEIQWLCSAYTPTIRPSTLPAAIDKPIDFMTFLDVPSPAQVGTQARRSTLLWNIVKRTVIDEVAKIALPIKSRGELADGLLDAVLDFGLKNVPVLGDLTIRELFRQVPGNQSDPLKNVLVAALTAAGYPRTPPLNGTSSRPDSRSQERPTTATDSPNSRSRVSKQLKPQGGRCLEQIPTGESPPASGVCWCQQEYPIQQARASVAVACSHQAATCGESSNSEAAFRISGIASWGKGP